jgi:hypothetical protein
MRAGIVGLPQAGKTTIFSILTRSAIEPALARGRKTEPNVGVVAVPDGRVDFLASVFHPRKTTYATVEFVDVGGVVRGQERNAMDPVRDVDALVHVVRAFEDPAVPHPDGSVDVGRDIRNFDAELILTDLASIEKRLDRLEKDLRKMKDQKLETERDFLVAAREWLESERPLREMEIDESLARQIRGFAFLSAKPMLYAINVGEDAISHMGGSFDETSGRPNTETVVICGKLEAEMAELGEDEIGSFLEDYGLTESGMVRLIRSTYHLLGLISFLTAGEEECRAWTIRRGTRAQQAAGAIHSDLEKHFIRAEVAAYGDFREHGGFPALREKGLLRLEGKQYPVADGDIITVRHSG